MVVFCIDRESCNLLEGELPHHGAAHEQIDPLFCEGIWSALNSKLIKQVNVAADTIRGYAERHTPIPWDVVLARLREPQPERVLLGSIRRYLDRVLGRQHSRWQPVGAADQRHRKQRIESSPRGQPPTSVGSLFHTKSRYGFTIADGSRLLDGVSGLHPGRHPGLPRTGSGDGMSTGPNLAISHRPMRIAPGP